ncbi:MAG TPA: hypothetical protein VNJ02_12555 [Vicinamibacterales bacterium]|nr:hypothetical protein [Vicinamibacterales bacterium]
MRSGIKACERAKCVVSTLTLIYSAIDALAALTRESQNTRATRKEFLDWVNSYLLPELDSDLTAMDIYGARCGVVHTYAPTSDLSRDGKVKLVVYKWREGHRPDDPILAERARSATVIEIEEVIDGLNRAVQAFERHIDADVALGRRVERNIVDLLCYEPWNPIAITVAA